ncbi:MAG: hypothetical protein FJ225_03260 [Lentisphaerae bacterium]|nr:hypothetical protein [Lentisphaerota bacterium]
MSGAASSARARRRPAEPGALDVITDAFHLLRSAPLAVLAAYYAGAAPFVLAFLFFWSDMSRSAFAARRSLAAALGMALMFLWMKIWQAVFAAGLRDLVAGARAAWGWRRVARLAAVQTALQPPGMLVIPLALFLMAPFYAAHAFYQNVTALGDGSGGDVREVARRALRLATLWPRQNHVVIWLLSPWLLCAGMLAAFGAARLVVSLTPELHHMQGLLWFAAALMLIFLAVLPLAPFGCAVAANVAALLIVAPRMLHALLGMQTVFTLSGWHAVFNTTFLMSVFGISYLCLDPVMKAVHVLRCFAGEARRTGEDLLVELKRARRETERKYGAEA